MRIKDDLQTTVVFLGISDDLKPNGIACCGSGFLLKYDGCGYLVTARHIAEALGSDPFVVRINMRAGDARTLHYDSATWYFHDDPNVDLAVIPFVVNTNQYEALYLPDEILALDREVQNDSVKVLGSFGAGDLTYTVGLFQLLSGKARNLPVVHSGSIALVPRDEKIPVMDWRHPHETIFVEGYLVETQALKGLSGSPVFVRRTLNLPTISEEYLRQHMRGDLTPYQASAPQMIVHLLGVWQSSWDAPIEAAMSGNNGRIPLGMGVVAPAYKIVEVLSRQVLVDMRAAEKRRWQCENAAIPD